MSGRLVSCFSVALPPSPGLSWPQFTHLNLLEGVGGHGNEHVEQHSDRDHGKDATEGLATEKLRHGDHAVLHADHGPKQKLDGLIETGMLGQRVGCEQWERGLSANER